MRRTCVLMLCVAAVSCAQVAGPGAGIDAATPAGNGGSPGSAGGSTGSGSPDGNVAVDMRVPDAAGDLAQPVDVAPVNIVPGKASCKRGIAYGGHSPADMATMSRSIAWWYNWSPRPEGSVGDAWRAAAIDFTPMVWGGRFDINQLATTIPEGTKYLLAFNEPNFTTQANLTPAQAAALWPQLEDLARRRGLLLVSPAVNFCGGACNLTSPYDWLDQFFAACPGCKVDYVAAHLYSCFGAGMRGYLARLATYGKPIWITEFACASDAPTTLPNQMRAMREVVDVLERDPNVFRYAWFSGRSNAIPNVNVLGPAPGESTPLGDLYASLPYVQSCPP
jgi:Glycosyl hydrolase catalytic core